MVKLVKYRGLYLTIKELKRLGIIRPRENYKIVKRKRKRKKTVKRTKRNTQKREVKEYKQSTSSFGSNYGGGGSGNGGVIMTPSSITTIQTEIAKENLRKLENDRNKELNKPAKIEDVKLPEVIPEKTEEMKLVIPDKKEFQNVSSTFNTETFEVGVDGTPDIPILNSKKIEDEPQIIEIDEPTPSVKQRDTKPVELIQKEGLELRKLEKERDDMIVKINILEKSISNANINLERAKSREKPNPETIKRNEDKISDYTNKQDEIKLELDFFDLQHGNLRGSKL